MEPIAFVVDKFRGFTKSTQDFVQDLIYNHGQPQSSASARQHPIERLKRLQREAFLDLMKLRDRQDKVERMVSSLYATSKGSPFREANTLVIGEVDFLGAFLLMHNNTNDEEVHQKSDALTRAGMRVGIDTRFTFETSFQQNDALVTEFVASQKHRSNLCDLSEYPLSLAKVFYLTNVGSWLSAIAIPVGARGRDVAALANPSHQGKGLTDRSSYGPPLLNQHNGSAIGLMVKRSNVVVSFAQFVSGLGMQDGSGRVGRCLSTFGQIVCQLPGATKLSLLGLQTLHQMPKSSSQHVEHGTLCIPLGSLKQHTSPETTIEASAPPLVTDSQENVSTRSIALMLESELDEFTKIEGWIEMKQSNPRHLEWAVTVCDDSSEDSFGWGISLNGTLEVGGPKSCDHLQIESYLKFNLGKKFSLKPGIAHIMDGNARMTALMLRSNWS